MLQRIQTLFLLIAGGLVSAMFFMPLSQIIIDEQIYDFNIYAIQTTNNELLINTYSLAILLVAILLINLLTIFLYKHRKLQMRLCVYNILLNVGFYGLFVFYYYQIMYVHKFIYTFRIAILFPLIVIILLWLAFRAIRKDDILIKSVDRIR
ncbi:MAG TPA: DUF4293 family protein [Bacteroidales bacterium]|nr:DUF4293 family protein [Bacteroidales bacterium]